MQPSFKDDRQITSSLTFDVQAQFVKLDFDEMHQIRRRRRILGPKALPDWQGKKEAISAILIPKTAGTLRNQRHQGPQGVTLTRKRRCAPYRRLPAGEIEALVLDQLRALLRQPEVVVGTWRAAQGEAPDLAEDAVRDALARFDPVWAELFPAEQERLIRLLVQRVVVGDAGAQISLNLEGLASLARDLSQPKEIAA